jgi:hypothetical protein
MKPNLKWRLALLLAALGSFLALTDARLSLGEPHCGFARSGSDLPPSFQLPRGSAVARLEARNIYWCGR